MNPSCSQHFVPNSSFATRLFARSLVLGLALCFALVSVTFAQKEEKAKDSKKGKKAAAAATAAATETTPQTATTSTATEEKGKKKKKTAMAAPAGNQLAQLVADWTRARDYTKEYLDAVPEDGLDFRPTPDIRSFAEQMLHLASANFAFIATATGAANPRNGQNLEKMAEFTGSKAALTAIVLESYDFAINSLPKMDMAKWDEPVKLFGRFDSTRGGALAKGFEHQTHHRGQTTIYLRLKGVKPPNEKLF